MFSLLIEVPLLQLLPVCLVVLKDLVDLLDEVLFGALLVKRADEDTRVSVVMALVLENAHLEGVLAEP